MRMRGSPAIWTLLLVTACAKTPPAAPGQPPRASAAIQKRLLEIAREYVDYGRVDDVNRWSPESCVMLPSEARFSASDDAATHGRKIYYLFARDRGAYTAGIKKHQPEEQVVVKEAWHPVPAPRRSGVELPRTPAGGIDVEAIPSDRGGRYVPFVEKGGQVFTTGDKAGLFIMLKREGAWTYATVTADGGRVIQSGPIASCAACHREAKPDSLFGLPGRRPSR